MNKQRDFKSLLSSVETCDLCPRMCGRKKVLSELNGSIDSKVLFIAEAPGRLGADCSGIPLFGDRTGENFELLLSNIGWNREDVFITNSILCNPRDDDGNNSSPTKQEIKNCSYYLAMTINLVDPDVIVTLGVKALESLKQICNHSYRLKENVAQCLSWNQRVIFPLYHMGPRALIHRNMTKQTGDFIELSHYVDVKKGLKKKRKSASRKTAPSESMLKLEAALELIVTRLQAVSMFKATKLLYLADYHYLMRFGSTITGATYLRMQEGPWVPNLKVAANELVSKNIMRIKFQGRKPLYELCTCYTASDSVLSNNAISFLDEEILKYGDYTDEKIKSTVYLTKPMKHVRRLEKNGFNTTKTPVIHQNKTIIDLFCIE